MTALIIVEGVVILLLSPESVICCVLTAIW